MFRRTLQFVAVVALLAACAHRAPAPRKPPQATSAGQPPSEPTAPPAIEYSTDPDLVVDVYDPERAWEGTMLLTDKHTGVARLIEANMHGEIVWEYRLPDEWGDKSVGFEAKMLSNGNVLFALTQDGLCEVDRDGNVVWSHPDPQVSHDADRLANGNTLISIRNLGLIAEVNPVNR